MDREGQEKKGPKASIIDLWHSLLALIEIKAFGAADLDRIPQIFAGFAGNQSFSANFLAETNVCP